MIDFLTSPQILWRLFFAFIVMTIAFAVVMLVWDFEIIDEMSDPDAIVTHIEAMSAEQRVVHAWMTGTLDVAYPFVYASLFAGLALRHFGKWGPLAAAPNAFVVPADLIEGATQVLLLNGAYEWAWVKAYVTPAKLVLFLLGAALSLVAVGVGFAKKRKGR